MAAVPALERVAEIEVRDVRRLPSNDMTFDIARTVADEIRAAVGRGAAGVVVTQGTDTIEEMAYAWDLLVAGDAPTVVTGAMRHAALTERGRRGNLLDAVRTAASPQARGLGCLVVLNEEIHSARTVRKAHTSSLAAFRSAGVGPLGWIAEGEPRLRERPYPRITVELPPDAPVVRPPLVTIAMDDDGWWLPAVAAGARAGRGGHRRRARARLAERRGRRAGRADPGGAGLAHRRRRGADRHLRRVRRLRDRAGAGRPDPGRDAGPVQGPGAARPAAQRGRRPRTDPHDHRRGGHALPPQATTTDIGG